MKKFLGKEELKQKMLLGSKKLAENVGSTLGPKGRNVILHPIDHTPIITKDGVTVAKFIELEDEFENAAAQAIKQASLQTNEDAGDGTTTACILADAIFRAAQKHITAGNPPVFIGRGIEAIASVLAKKIGERATRISSLDDIRHIATISSNGDEQIGELISQAIDIAGKDGAIAIEEARDVQTTLEVTEGFILPGGYTSGEYVTHPQNSLVKYSDARILVTDERLENINQMLSFLKPVAEDPSRPPLIIVADQIDNDAHASLIANATRGSMRIASINVPGYGDDKRANLRDLATVTNATFFSRREGHSLDSFRLADLGYVQSVEISRHQSVFLNGAGSKEDVEARKALIKADIQETKSLQEAARLQERLSRLAAAAVIVKVGAMTEVEMIEKKHRIEDAMEAVRSAQEEGHLPGGGTALSRLINEIVESEDNVALKIMKEACEAPLRKICENADERADVIINDILSSDIFEVGFDAATSRIVNLSEVGIIDPAKVTRCALMNAVSAAKTLIIADHAIIEVRKS